MPSLRCSCSEGTASCRYFILLLGFRQKIETAERVVHLAGEEKL